MITLLLMAVSLSVDAFAVSVANGISARALGRRTLPLMAFLFGSFQLAMPLLGFSLGRAVYAYIQSFDHWIAFCLLAFIGGRMLIQTLRGGGEEEGRALTLPVLLLQALATSIDALAVGVTLAFMDENIWLAVSVIGAVCVASSLLGGLLGRRVGIAFRRRAELTGGLVLVGLGVKILLEHLFFSGAAL